MANTTSSPKFKAGERVAYLSGDTVILGHVDEIVLFAGVYRYRIVWEDFLPDREMRDEPNFRNQRRARTMFTDSGLIKWANSMRRIEGTVDA